MPEELAIWYAKEFANKEGYNDIIALQNTTSGEIITSDYSYIGVAGVYDSYDLIHKDVLKGETPASAWRDYRNRPIGIEKDVDAEYWDELATPELLYTATLDLNDYVVLGVEGESFGNYYLQDTLAADLGIDVKYSYELVGADGKSWDSVKNPYLGEDGRTDQNKFVTLSEDGIMAVDSEWLNQSGRPAVNRTPLVKVTATTVADGKTLTLAEAFIKVRIVEEETRPLGDYFKTVTDHFVQFCGDDVKDFANGVYKDAHYAGDSLRVAWEEVNVNVLGGLDLSYEAFLKEYDTTTLYVLDITKDKDGNLDTAYVDAKQYEFPKGLTYFSDPPEDWATSTNISTLFVDSEVAAPSMDTIEFAYKAKKNTDKTPNIGFKFGYEVTAKTPTEHDHKFVTPTELILNPDYLLGSQNKPVEAKPATKNDPAVDEYTAYAGVRVKGKDDGEGNFVYSSSLIEHFDLYGKNIKFAEDATVTFEIMHSTADKKWEVLYGNDDFKFVTEDGNVDKVTFTAAEFAAIVASPSTSPDIKYMGSFLTEDIKVLVKVTENCTAKADKYLSDKEKVGYYYVVFETPFTVLLSSEDVELGTFKNEADTTVIPTDIKVVERDNEEKVIYTFVDGTMVATDYAKSQYGLVDVTGTVKFKSGSELTYPYANNTKPSFGGCLTFGEDKETGELFVAWDNLGTDLLVDKYADYNLVVKIGTLYTLDAKGKVTVLSTANTKAKYPAGRADKIAAENPAPENPAPENPGEGEAPLI